MMEIGMLPDWIDPRRTALVLIDMQVDFGSPDGVLGRAGLDMTEPAKAIEQSVRLEKSARAAGVACVFVGLQTRPDLDSRSWKEWMRRRGQNENSESGVCREGTRGAKFMGPQPMDGDIVISKLRYSAFFGTPLDASLKARGLDTLVICGLTTECCIDCSVRDAFHLDYHVFIPRDACAAYDMALHTGSLATLELNCAIGTSTNDVIGAWGRSARGHTHA